MLNANWHKNSDKYNIKMEQEILKIHLGRLFREMQRQPMDGFKYQYADPQRADTVREDPSISSGVESYENELKKAGVAIAKSIHASNTEQLIEPKIREEVSQLIDRMKIYGI